MEKGKFIIGAQRRVDGYYAVIKEEDTNKKVFDQKCKDIDEAMQVASQQWNKLNNK